MNFVMELTEKQTQMLLDFYRHHVKITQNEHIRAMIKDENLTITVYRTGKIMFQGKVAEEAYFFWLDKFELPQKPRPIPEDHEYYTPSIGSDESGVGDYFGPLTVCAAYLSGKDVKIAKELNVRDSKTISDKAIIELAPKLIKHFTHSLLILNNKKYNKLISEGYNSNTLKAYLHAQAHKKILQKIDHTPKIIVDQFCQETTYHKYLKSFKEPIRPDLFLTKAETFYASVAVASIIARYAFLVHLHKMSKELGVKLLKGASKEVDRQASKLIKSGGMNTLNRFAKVHFKTTEKAKSLLDSDNPSY